MHTLSTFKKHVLLLNMKFKTQHYYKFNCIISENKQKKTIKCIKLLFIMDVIIVNQI